MTGQGRDSERCNRWGCGHHRQTHDGPGGTCGGCTCTVFQPDAAHWFGCLVNRPAHQGGPGPCDCDQDPPPAPSPVEGETEPTAMCTACGQWHSLLVLLYARCDVSGDGQHHVDDRYPPTRAARVYADNLAKMPGRTPPVVGDQPEETDTVNDETHLRALNAIIDAAMSDRPGADEFRMGFAAMLPVNWRAMADELRLQAARLDAATSPAVGAEVRVEWGVRWEHPEHVGRREQWFNGDAQRDGRLEYLRAIGNAVETSQRTTTTSAWQPVTDDRPHGDGDPTQGQQR